MRNSLCLKNLHQIILIICVCVVMPVTVNAAWWDKGKDLLRNLTSGSSAVEELTSGEIEAGLREALRVGAGRVVEQLGVTDGFNSDPAIHIPLPEKMATVQSTLGKVGLDSMLNDLETRLNRAAEDATPKAARIFEQAISDMTLDDIKGIYNGPDDAATRYFQGKMSVPLTQEMRPIVSDSLAHVGAVQSYDSVMAKYKAIPFVPDVKADLTDYVIEGGLNGIFHYLAIEETKIRQDPLSRTTELLKKVFSK